MLEIVILGRGGQGAQTAGNLLAQAFFRENRQVQSFASYGGARRGSPVSSMIRIDDEPIRLRCNIEQPDAMLCFDSSLLAQGLPYRLERDTLLVVNATGLADKPSTLDDCRVCPVDGVAIARRYELGRIVNSALLGAFCCLLGAPALDTLSATIRESAPVKPEENVAACRAGFEAARRRYLHGDSVREASA